MKIVKKTNNVKLFLELMQNIIFLKIKHNLDIMQIFFFYITRLIFFAYNIHYFLIIVHYYEDCKNSNNVKLY